VHWSVALLVACDLLNEAGANPWHRYIGYAAGALVVLRLVWGLFGPRHASLAAMAASARELPAYLKTQFSRHGRYYVGHNPAGAWMALTLWLLVLIIVITGWMLQLDTFWGDERLQTLHTAVAYVLAACVVAHVAGALVTSAFHRTNLIKAMITGDKPDRSSTQQHHR
jgi:cytochrome b